MCFGQGFFFISQNEKHNFWSCSHCNGVGTLICGPAPPTIRIHWKKNKKMDDLNRQLQKDENTAFGPIQQWKPKPLINHNFS